MQDLIVDSIGAIVACIVGWIYIKKQNDTLFNNYFDNWFLSERKKNAELKKGDIDATNKEDIKTI